MKRSMANDTRLLGLRMPSPCLSLLPLLLLTPSPDQRDVLWDNHITIKGDVFARAISPPLWRDIRVVDDVLIPQGTRWHVTSAWLNVVEDEGWSPGSRMEMYVWRSGFGGRPGQGIVAWLSAPLRRSATGSSYFNRPAYIHGIEGLVLELDTGVQWVGFRHPDASGRYTAYWLTSDNVDNEGRGSTHFFSVDGGKSWQWAGEGWHSSFILYGYEEPSISPSSFSVTQGQLVSGGTLSLTHSDDDRLVIRPRRAANVNTPSAEIVVQSSAGPHRAVTWLSFTVQARATALGVEQEVDLWSFDDQRWFSVHRRNAATDDTFSFRRFRVPSRYDVAPRKFVSPEGLVRARIRWFDRGVPSVGWTVQVNQAGWHAVLN